MPEANEIEAYYRARYSVEYREIADGEARDQAWIQDHHREYYRSHVENLVQRSGRPSEGVTLVDYGSSMPLLVHEATLLGIRAVAVDYDDSAHTYGRLHDVRVITPEDFERLELQSVDIIRFSHVLEHLLDPRTTFLAAMKKVRPGGIVYITQPNFPVLKARPAQATIRDAEYPVHLHFFSALSLKRLLDDAGVEVHQMWTHPGAEQERRRYGPQIDLRYARKSLEAWRAIGDPSRGKNGNYPFYCGENSEVFAAVPR